MRIIAPERDEIRARHRGKKPPTLPAATADGTGAQAMLWLLTLLVLGLAAATGYLFWQLQTMAESRAQLAAQVAALSGADESQQQSGAAIQSTLKAHEEEMAMHMSEIRKLWGVAYDRNRPAIEKLQQAQTDTKARLDSLASTTARLSPLAGEQATMRSRLLELAAETRDLADRSTADRDRIATNESKITQHEEAIQAIDEYRRQTNQRLLRLERTAPPGG